jgi:serine/threonine-protein kinase
MDRKPNPSFAETVASDSLMGNRQESRDDEISRVTSSPHEDEGRFVPGTLLGGRYRIIGLLGRGGMGEVYRATDLTLGQSVALKFLPEEASRNQRLLERFHGEVRVARLVSHPNVCRVYDIGQVEGMPFISMEYVDGEDLGSLLLRIGRLPADKAVQTARKLCAGLTAAHDRGVIHRDLKPANIMIDKRGEVVIMDFGLAAIADQLSGAEVHNGTPAYMSPEQLKGTGVTAKSDIYALGLVLYELFTGKRPYDAKSVQQLIDLEDAVQLTSMISVAADIDPAVEKVIRRCLEPDPAKRPGTALAVAAALPGGDPLAMALAAGETPSPEMVAAGDIEGMPRKWALLSLALAVCFLLVQIPIRQQRTAFFRATLERSPDVLAHLSRGVADSFGYTRKPADSHVWLEHRWDLPRYLSTLPEPRHWDDWYAAESPIVSVYRESLAPLDAWPYSLVNATNPAPLAPGMAGVILDGNGNLRDFAAMPYAGGSSPTQPETVFRAAGLEMTRFSETTPEGVPARPFDQRRAWRGPHPKIPSTELLVEMASWKGQITRASITIVRPKTASDAATGPTLWGRLRSFFIWSMQAFAAFVVFLMAVRNLRRGRTDLHGSLRVAAACFLLAGVGWAGWCHPLASDALIEHGISAAGDWLFSAVVLFLVYLALEPEVRARWPHAIVTWNRALAGRWRDPQVASDILIGAAVGAGMFTVFKLFFVVFSRHVEPVNFDISVNFAMGTRAWIGGHAGGLSDALRSGLLIFMAIFGLRQFLRYDAVAAVAAALLFTMGQSDVIYAQNWALMTLLYVVIYSGLAFVLLRYGLVATIATVFFGDAGNSILLGGDWNTWYAPYGIASLLLLIGIAVWAFYLSLGGRELIGDEAES